MGLPLCFQPREGSGMVNVHGVVHAHWDSVAGQEHELWSWIAWVQILGLQQICYESWDKLINLPMVFKICKIRIILKGILNESIYITWFIDYCDCNN